MEAKPFLTEFFGLEEPAGPDPDGTYGGAVCPPDQAKTIWWMAWLTMASVVAATYMGYYDMALLSLIVLITSLLYWSNPTYCWRRNLDIIAVQIALWWHMYRAISAENRVPYFIIVGVGSLAFMAGWALFSAGSTWAGTLAHVVLHLCANLSNIILYMGHIPPLKLFPFIAL